MSRLPCPLGGERNKRCREVFSSLDDLRIHLFNYHKCESDVAEWLANADSDFVRNMIRLSRRIDEEQSGLILSNHL